MEEKKDAVVATEANANETTTKDSSSNEEKDYKAIAEANEALANAEKARADAAEALIIKNKALAKRKEGGDEGDKPLTKEDVAEIVKSALASHKTEEDSPEAKALSAAELAVKEARAKTAELARALKAKDSVSKDTATTHFDGEKGNAPKLPDNSPLKAFTYVGNGIYSQKLQSGKTMFKNTKAGPGQPKSWIA